MRRASNRRSGYALVWVILTIAIIAVLAAAAGPTLVTLDDRARAESAADQLRAIAKGFRVFEDSINDFPGTVSQLTNTLRRSDVNTCGPTQTMSTADTVKWAEGAPYVPFYLPTNGLWTEIGRIRNAVPLRTNPNSEPPVFVEIPGVTGDMAALLDLLVDHGTGDTVSYNALVNDTTTVRYRVVSSPQVPNNRC